MGQDAIMNALIGFKKTLESFNIKVERLILYGSYVAGSARDDSDIDVIVVSPNFINKNYWERIDMLTEAIYKVFLPIEASAFTPEEWDSGNSFLCDYAKNGISI